MLCVSYYYLVWFVWLMVNQFIMIYLLNAVIKPFQYSLNGTDRSCIYDNITKLSNNICFFNLGNGDFKTYHTPPYSEKRIGVDGNLQWNVARCLLQKKCFSFNYGWFYFCPWSSLELLQFSWNCCITVACCTLLYMWVSLTGMHVGVHACVCVNK